MNPYIEIAVNRKKSISNRCVCGYCKNKIDLGVDIIDLLKGSWKGHPSYEHYHFRCFLKVLLIGFPELLTDEDLIKEITMDKLK